jgi:shikimate kinase
LSELPLPADGQHGVDVARPHVVILGVMGVGKSTTGVALADRLGWRYIDSDRDIERLTGGTGRDFAADHGIAALHQLEAAVLLGALAGDDRSVITAAASTVENSLVQSVINRRAVVVRLVVGVDEALERQAQGGHRRPMSREELTELMARREPLFAALADLELSAVRTTGDLVEAVVAHLSASGLGTDSRD